MAESMKGLKRTCRCAEVTKADIGKKVTLMGWVQKSRNKGGIIFVDLRDRSGIMQIIFENGPISEEGFEKAAKLRSEFVIAVEGEVMARSGAVNENLATGELEVKAESLRILSEAETPPFPIEEDSKTREELRLKYRYLDLRRPDIQRNLIMRSKVAMLTREFMSKEGFLAISQSNCSDLSRRHRRCGRRWSRYGPARLVLALSGAQHDDLVAIDDLAGILEDLVGEDHQVLAGSAI